MANQFTDEELAIADRVAAELLSRQSVQDKIAAFVQGAVSADQSALEKEYAETIRRYAFNNAGTVGMLDVGHIQRAFRKRGYLGQFPRF